MSVDDIRRSVRQATANLALQHAIGHIGPTALWGNRIQTADSVGQEFGPEARDSWLDIQRAARRFRAAIRQQEGEG